eukprot:COSAG04_NODE_505_length_13342_cov_2.786529_10_plen_369_part_00
MRPACARCCRVIVRLLVLVLVLFLAVAFVPATRPPINALIHRYCTPGGAAFRMLFATLQVAQTAGCRGDYIGCMKQAQVSGSVQEYGWDGGVAIVDSSLFGDLAPLGGLIINPNTHQQVITTTQAFSHAEYRKVAHSPTAERFPDMFIMSNVSNLPAGVIPQGVMPAVLGLNTGSAEHTARRSLMAEVFTALGRHPGPFSIVAPPELDAGEAGPYSTPWTADPRAVQDVLGLNLFHMLFGVDVSDHLAALYEYDGLLATAVLGVFGKNVAAGARLAEIRAPIERLVFASEVGQKYLAKAEKELGNGEARLREVIFISMFAGYGGTGTLCRYTVTHILTDPARYIPLFKKDPEAFVLESARLWPSVAGM